MQGSHQQVKLDIISKFLRHNLNKTSASKTSSRRILILQKKLNINIINSVTCKIYKISPKLSKHY